MEEPAVISNNPTCKCGYNFNLTEHIRSLEKFNLRCPRCFARLSVEKVRVEIKYKITSIPMHDNCSLGPKKRIY